uniref:NADH-ubiquinone oxidoreductase chain 1 n=1 Tax=Phyllomimus detersus TaxID=948396 RepID=A0A0N9LSQ3_9ORTH|nr:NADH dehydrogenase subunit 1 [Phyllomimus detersus]ALG66363.1 NADH dehydrogenase subunit 1 [Phyllomimus detersus]
MGFSLFFMMVGMLILVISVLVGMAFLTLLERSVLGYIQIRKGPNKVGLIGLPQPLADALKLYSSEQMLPEMSNYMLYYICPVLNLVLSLLVWLVYPMVFGLLSFNLGLLFFLCCTSMGVYGVMFAGWASNSKYSLLGGLRSVAQTISYEVSLALVMLSLVFLVGSYDLLMLVNMQYYVWFVVITFPLMLVWFASCLAETNRTPFDFAEGESELVSGFNVEYSSGSFALIFMAEYTSILFMSMLFCMMFLGGDVYSILFSFKVGFMSLLFIWVRGTVPRFRYDKLMYLAWSMFLPVSLNYLMFFLGVGVMLFSVEV